MTTLKVTAQLLGIAVILSACQAADLSSQVTAPALPASYARPERSGTAPSATEASPISFGDQRLNLILKQALVSNLSIDQARSRLVAARALANSSISSFVPDANIAGSASAGSEHERQNDLSRRPLQLNLETGWEIPLFRQARNTALSADLVSAMAETDVDAARLAVTAEIAASYVHLRARQHNRRNVEQIASILEKRLRIAKARKANGLATTDLVSEATLRLQDAQAKELMLDNAIGTITQELATLQGTAFPDPSLLVIEPQPTVTSKMVRSGPSDVIRSRPDVRRAEFAALQAGAEVGLAQADLYPRLRLSGMIGVGSRVDGSLLGFTGGPSLSMPVFDLGKRRDVVTARQAQFQEALSAYRNAVLLAFEEVSGAARSYEDAATRTALATTQVRAAKSQVARTGTLATEGLTESGAYLESQLSYLEAQNRLVDCVEEQSLALIAFYKAAGMQSGFISNGTPVVSADNAKS